MAPYQKEISMYPNKLTIFSVCLASCALGVHPAAVPPAHGQEHGTLPSALAPCDSLRIVGEWLSPEGDLVIAITRTGDTYSGTIVRLTETFWDDPDRAKQRQKLEKSGKATPLVGTELLSGLRCEEGRWIDGTLYVPMKNRRLACSAQVSDDDQTLELKVKAGFRTRTKTWTRIENPPTTEGAG
jgi:uncharacterized protein (DUF2147 family)